MVGSSLLLISISIACASCSNLTLLRSYDAKTCKNEPSCHLVDEPTLPANRRTLRNRPCMCDANCVIYRDCCTDSKYYDELEQSRPPPFYCQSTYKVYLKTTCPDSWTDEDTRSKCSLATSALRSDDTSLIVPVTNLLKNITYGNVYCALCNGDVDNRPWALSPLCGEAPPGLLQVTTAVPPAEVPPAPAPVLVPNSRPTEAQKVLRLAAQKVPPFAFEYSISTPMSKIIFRQSKSLGHRPLLEYLRRKRETKIQVDFYRYIKFVNDIWKGAKYDAHSGYFVTKYQEKDMICVVSAKLTSDLKPYTRSCVPNIIEHCQAADPEVDKQCRSHTSLVFNKRNNKAYRNKFCASCDGAELNYLTGCPIRVRDDVAPTLAVHVAK